MHDNRWEGEKEEEEKEKEKEEKEEKEKEDKTKKEEKSKKKDKEEEKSKPPTVQKVTGASGLLWIIKYLSCWALLQRNGSFFFLWGVNFFLVSEMGHESRCLKCSCHSNQTSKLKHLLQDFK